MSRSTFLLILCALCAVCCVSKRNQTAGLQAKPGIYDLKVLLISAEQTGVFNTGGLGHTVESLASALRSSGIQADVLMPYYSEIPSDIQEASLFANQSIDVRLHAVPHQAELKSHTFKVYKHTNQKSKVVTWLLKDSPPGGGHGLFENATPENDGKRYTNSNEGEAFLAFNQAASQFVLQSDYDIINTHDWHAGFVSWNLSKRDFLESVQKKKFLHTISNMGYQGIFPKSLHLRSGMKQQEFESKAEFYNQFNFMKFGIEAADFVLTVAPNYLKEIASKRFGSGLEGLVAKLAKEFRISAILNGTDVESWNPSKSFHPNIKHTFTPSDLSGKALGKAWLQKELQLEVNSEIPLYCFTSRIADQKGFSYLPAALEKLLKESDVQIVILGDGDKQYVKKLQEIAKQYPKKLLYRPFDSNLEKPLTVYSDFFVNLPWYEPSGTNQLFAMKSGTIPIVSRVGGLANFVENNETGFLVDIAVQEDGVATDLSITAENAYQALKTSAAWFKYNPKLVNEMRVNAMKQDNSWGTRMSTYKELFHFLQQNGSEKLKEEFSGSGKTSLDFSAQELLDAATNIE